jgi:hypothetical protein
MNEKKTFDCVEMKRQAQQKLRAEFEAHKDEYPDFFAFLAAKTQRSPWQREFWAKIQSRAQRQHTS